MAQVFHSIDRKMAYDEEDLSLDSDSQMDITSAIIDDDMPAFVDAMKKLFNHGLAPKLLEQELARNPKLCPEFILHLVCRVGALNCAKALFKRLPGVYVDLNIPLTAGRYPLHVAASNFHSGLVDVFLHYGARTDVGILENGSPNNLLPLNVALESLHYHPYLVDWTPKESIFKLITILCLPQMRRVLETNRLLAQTTEKVHEVLRYYAKDGQLIEMAVLLMVAKEKIKGKSLFKDGLIVDGITTAYESIKQDIVSLVGEQVDAFLFHGRKSELFQLCEAKIDTLISAAILLRVFETVGDVVGSYLQSQENNVTKEMVVKDVSTILRKAAIRFKAKDINLNKIDCKSSDCESSNVKEAMQPLEKIGTYHQSLGRGLLLDQKTVWCHMQKRMPWRVRVPCLLAMEQQEMKKTHVGSARAFHSVQSGHFLGPFKQELQKIRVGSSRAFHSVQSGHFLRPLNNPGSSESARLPMGVPYLLAHEMKKLPVTSYRAFHSDLSGVFVRPFSIPSCGKIIKAQSNRERNAILRPLLPFRLRNPLAFLVSLIKRGMKHV